MSELPPEVITAAAEALRGYTGDCICHEAYTSRNLTDPACQHCDLLGAHEDILSAAYPFIAAQALREAREDARAEYLRCSETKAVKCGDGFAYISTDVYGAKFWGEFSDWLRARADRIEGK